MINDLDQYIKDAFHVFTYKNWITFMFTKMI